MRKRMEAFVRKHTDLLLAFTEGRMPFNEWRQWVDENAAEIQTALERSGFIKLKYRSYDEVSSLLRRCNIAFEKQKDLCQRCGAKLFEVVPGKTTKQEIIDFAISSRLRHAKEIVQDGWIHPGTYCPNECTMILRSYGSDGFKKRLREINDD